MSTLPLEGGGVSIVEHLVNAGFDMAGVCNAIV